MWNLAWAESISPEAIRSVRSESELIDIGLGLIGPKNLKLSEDLERVFARTNHQP
jgi:hypothetical protein